MNFLSKVALFGSTVLALAACGGGDTAESLNIGPGQVRFVNAAPGSPSLALYRKDDMENEAGVQAYEGASKYYDTVNVTSDWSARDAITGTQLAVTSMRVENGTLYTLVALPGSGGAYKLLQISDPYNKPLDSDRARVRIVNGTPEVGSFDVYITAVGADIGSATPAMAGVAGQMPSPASGSDSFMIGDGTYQIRLTGAGSKSVFFSGTFKLGNDDDVLLITLPGAASGEVKILDIPAGKTQSNTEILNEAGG